MIYKQFSASVTRGLVLLSAAKGQNWCVSRDVVSALCDIPKSLLLHIRSCFIDPKFHCISPFDNPFITWGPALSSVYIIVCSVLHRHNKSYTWAGGRSPYICIVCRQRLVSFITSLLSELRLTPIWLNCCQNSNIFFESQFVRHSHCFASTSRSGFLQSSYHRHWHAPLCFEFPHPPSGDFTCLARPYRKIFINQIKHNFFYRLRSIFSSVTICMTRTRIYVSTPCELLLSGNAMFLARRGCSNPVN